MIPKIKTSLDWLNSKHEVEQKDKSIKKIIQPEEQREQRFKKENGISDPWTNVSSLAYVQLHSQEKTKLPEYLSIFQICEKNKNCNTVEGKKHLHTYTKKITQHPMCNDDSDSKF